MATRAARARTDRAGFAGDAGRFAAVWADLFRKHELLTYAGSIARSMLVASVAVVLLLIGLAGAAGRQDLWRSHLAPQVHKRVLPDVYAGLNETVDHVFHANSPGLIVFAALLAVWEVSGSVRGVSGALNRVYETKETRSWKERYPLSVALSAAIVLALVTALLLVMAVGGLVHGAASIPFAIVRWGAAILLVGLAFGLLVRFAPAQPRAKKWSSVGSGLVVVGWIVEALVFKWYLTSLANFRTAVGSLTVVLFVIAYLYTASIILLVGIELDELLREDGKRVERTVFRLLGDLVRVGR